MKNAILSAVGEKICALNVSTSNHVAMVDFVSPVSFEFSCLGSNLNLKFYTHTFKSNSNSVLSNHFIILPGLPAKTA